MLLLNDVGFSAGPVVPQDIFQSLAQKRDRHYKPSQLQQGKTSDRDIHKGLGDWTDVAKVGSKAETTPHLQDFLYKKETKKPTPQKQEKDH